ncbi:MAG: aminotransferase, partial [Anaerolineae bacterium]|nr:aminotransferase [Anaerolineae bacterium]
FTKAVERNVAFVPGTNFFANGGGDETMRLNFSCMPPERIREGIERLGHIIIQAQAEAPVKSS